MVLMVLMVLMALMVLMVLMASRQMIPPSPTLPPTPTAMRFQQEGSPWITEGAVFSSRDSHMTPRRTANRRHPPRTSRDAAATAAAAPGSLPTLISPHAHPRRFRSSRHHCRRPPRQSDHRPRATKIRATRSRACPRASARPDQNHPQPPRAGPTRVGARWPGGGGCRPATRYHYSRCSRRRRWTGGSAPRTRRDDPLRRALFPVALSWKSSAPSATIAPWRIAAGLGPLSFEAS